MTRCLCLATALATAALAQPALAQETAPATPPTVPGAPSAAPTAAPGGGFGAPGQVALSGDFSLFFSQITDSDAKRSFVELAPALDYFIMPRLAVGGQVRFSYSKAGAFSETVFGVGPRVGYDLPIAPMFSFFPRAGLYYRRVSREQAPVTRGYDLFSFTLLAPALFHPVPHFFVGLGPFFVTDLAGGSAGERTTQIGLTSVIGGWFDW